MENQARARGRTGWLNIGGVRAQCLACGSRELVDAREPKQDVAAYTTPHDETASGILAIMTLPGFPWQGEYKFPFSFGPNGVTSTGHPQMLELRRIGVHLNAKGGKTLMVAAAERARDLAHRRRQIIDMSSLEHAWDYIGDWRA